MATDKNGKNMLFFETLDEVKSNVKKVVFGVASPTRYELPLWSDFLHFDIGFQMPYTAGLCLPDWWLMLRSSVSYTFVHFLLTETKLTASLC